MGNTLCAAGLLMGRGEPFFRHKQASCPKSYCPKEFRYENLALAVKGLRAFWKTINSLHRIPLLWSCMVSAESFHEELHGISICNGEQGADG